MPPTPKKKQKATTSAREVVYPKVEVKLCEGEQAITVALAKKLLGWQEQPKDCTDYHFIDTTGKKIKCHNNVTNRPLYLTVVANLQQEHLRKRWLMNGEPIIIGKTGFILNGQHTLIALIFAAQVWESDPDKWNDWDSSPTMEKLVVFGIDESDTVVNTMDTCKPRTLADAIYRSEFFADLPKDKNRRVVARILDYAVKMLWHRVGADQDAFAPRRTHSEALSFISKHPRILQCVKHIYDEEGDKRQVSRYISTGYAAGLLYLMGCCKTENVAEYRENPDESLLDFSMWDEACDFWVRLAGSDKSLAAIDKVIEQMAENNQGSRIERTAVLCNAWLLTVAGKPVTAKGIELSYAEDEHGFPIIGENPTFGGIDSVDLAEQAHVDPTPEELEERAEEIRQEREAKKANPPPKKGKKKQSSITVGIQVWVPEDGGHWTGIVEEIYDGPNGQVCKIRCKNKKVFEESVENCLVENPEVE